MTPDTLKLYHSPASPNSRRVRIFLAEKGLKVPLVAVDLGKGEQHSAAYRPLNPRRVVPTLVLDQPLLPQYLRLRQHTQALVARLNHEDMAVQSMPDASPVKWHLAHTTWFFEIFLLSTSLPGYHQFDPSFGYLFNSYYEALGPRQPRP